MKRRFRPTIGWGVLENTANVNVTTSLSDTATTTQSRRRARIKPKVGLVSNLTRSQNPSTSNQQTLSTTASTCVSGHIDTPENVSALPENVNVQNEEDSTTLQPISTESEKAINEVRILPSSNEVNSTLNQSIQQAQDKLATASSGLVVKRKRHTPRNKPHLKPSRNTLWDISTIPIASNIEIEQEEIRDDIDHPILELPLDLMHENLAECLPRANVSSTGLKERFQQSDIVKVVLSRLHSESTSDVHKINESRSGDAGSTAEDKSGTALDESVTSVDGSSTSMDIFMQPSTPFHDVSSNIPETAIEEAILNSTEPLPEIVIECPECPEPVFCLTEVNDGSIDEQVHNTTQMQPLPGTLEASVAGAKRRASAESEVPALENDVGDEKSKTTDGLSTDVLEFEVPVPGNDVGGETSKTTDISSTDVLEFEVPVPRNDVVGETSKTTDISSTDVLEFEVPVPGNDVGGETSKTTDGSSTDHVLEFEAPSLGNDIEGEKSKTTNSSSTDVLEFEAPTSGNDVGGEKSKPTDRSSADHVPDVPLSQAAEESSGKRKAKAVKPKISAKRSRKKTAVAQETNEQDNADIPDSGTNSTTRSLAVPETQDTPPTSQKRKKGRPKGSKKTTTEKPNQSETASIEETPSKKRKGQRSKVVEAVVNVGSMKISDMITYNPMTNPMTSATEEERPSFLGGISSQSGQSETALPANEDQPAENAGVCAPRVTIDADGNIVLDEESLVIQSTPAPNTLDTEVVFENANQQYKATQKRKNMDRWAKEETLRFYEVLSQTGTDFSLMAKVFPKRNRTELKRKFKHEEKVNRDLIDEALRQMIPLNASLFKDYLEQTEEEILNSPTADTETAAQVC